MRNADDVGRAFVNLSDALWVSGDAEAALRRVHEGTKAASALGVESVYGYYLRMNGVFFAWELGEWATAGRLYREAMTRTLDGGRSPALSARLRAPVVGRLGCRRGRGGVGNCQGAHRGRSSG